MSSSPSRPGIQDLPERVNVARYLPRAAAERPDATAVRVQRKGRFDDVTYRELETRSNRMAAGLREAGVRGGDRVCVFVPAGIELLAITYALFKLGAVPVLADPGMGRKRLLACLERMEPRVFVGVRRAHLARKLFPTSFRSVQLAITVGTRLPFGCPSLERLESGMQDSFEVADTHRDDPAAILFTSGSTGPPKGVEYTHGMFDAQVTALGELYAFEPGEVDLCCFPLFALFDVAFGMTSVFPEMDVSRPSTCNPARIFAAAKESRATTSFGSPAIWRRVVPWCIENGFKLEDMRRVLVAGAPVPPDLIREFHAVLPLEGDVHTPYGATEALPVASIRGRDVAPGLVPQITSGAGTCVGTPAPRADVHLIKVTDEVIENWSDELLVPLGQLGEVVVRGPVVTRSYAQEPELTRAAKISDDAGEVWHRMGDVGRFDAEGRLWFCGRKSHRLETRGGLRMPVPTENVFNTHPRVNRTALVGVGERGSETPVLVVEPLPGEMPRGEVMTEGFIMQLKSIGRKSAITKDIEVFMFRAEFPVDVRHNAKIHREELKAWAEELLA